MPKGPTSPVFTSAAAAGESALSPTVAGKLMGRLRDPRPLLTDRETEVLRAVADGATNRQAAASLNVMLDRIAALMADHGQPDRARDMLDQAPESIREAPELAAVRTKLELAEKVAQIGDPAALEARLAGNEDDHDARFDLAQILNARGEREAAADHLLAIMKADREWREDGARTELLKFFEAWGQTDPATVKARRKLSSLLFR